MSTNYAASTATTINLVQSVLLSLQSDLSFGGYLCPVGSTIDTVSSTSFTHIIVGAGTAGSVLAYRLSNLTGAKVLVLEAGGCPPLESLMPGYFTLLPLSTYDYAYNIFNDSYASQNVKPQSGATSGKMLGGSGSINHMMDIPPTKEDFDHWAAAANDDSWAFPDIAYYFAKATTVTDEGVQAQNEIWTGTNGPTKLKRQESSLMDTFIAGNVEYGLTYKNDSDGLCVNSPLFAIGDNLRQCGVVAYVNKTRSDNVLFLTGAEVTKVLFDGTTATGVQFTYSGSTYTVNGNNIILSAGAIKTPQLLMASGVGDKTALDAMGIDLVVDSPDVGQKLSDHVASSFLVSVDIKTTASAADPHQFPVPMVTSYDARDKSQHQPEIQYISLYFPAGSEGLLELCTDGFKYLDSVCNKWYSSNLISDSIMIIPNLLHPNSKGSVTMNSTDPSVQPIIKTALLSNGTDVDTFAELLLQYVEPLLKTSALQELGASFVDLDFCTSYTRFSLDFWKCYIVEMSSTMWHYSGTCAMGTVVDAKLNVIGTSNLKAIDASNIPYLNSGNIGSAVRTLAEKAADYIKSEFST